MASTVDIQITSSRSQTQTRLDVRKGSDKDREGVKSLENFLHRIVGRTSRATVYVSTGNAAPVAASGTWTLATVIATDEADLGGVAFTFTASASLETDVSSVVGTAKAFASSTDLDLTTGYITESAHGYLTGDVGRMTTSSALPTGLALSTDYFVIKISSGVYALAASLADAVAGIPIKPTALGTGNQTFTPVSDKCLAVRLAAAVNAHSTLKYIVSASAALAVVTVTALIRGVIGNFIQFTDNDSTITSSGSGYLAGGLGGVMEAAQVYDCGL